MCAILKEKNDLVKLKCIMVSTLVFGLIAHGYAYFNSNFSHDSISSLYVDRPEIMISIGRFLRPVYRCVRGDFVLPVLSGALSLLFFGLAIYLIVDALGLKKKLSYVLTTGILLTSSSITLLNATFMHDADSYALSMLLVSIGIWITVKTERGIYFSTIFYFLSLGLYQAYINIPIFVFLMLAFSDIIEGNKIKGIILNLLKRMVSVAVSMVFYFVAYKIILSITGIGPSTTYNSTNNALDLSIATFISRFLRTFNSEIRWLIFPKVHHSGMIAGINLLILLASVVMMFYLTRKNKESADKNRVLLAIGVTLMMPFGINAMTLISNQWHDLTIFSLFFVYVFFMFLSEKISERINKEKKETRPIIGLLITMLLSTIIFNNCIYSNEAYLKKELEAQSTLSTFTRIIDKMEQTDGYEVGKTPVVFVGALDYSDITEKRKGFDYNGFGLSEYYSTTYFGTYEAYLKNYLGYPINLLPEDDSMTWQTNANVKDMPEFPYNGCCRLIDGTMIVKLSEGGVE